jgi:flagellar biosynthesis activator protein FlaF
MHPNSHARAAYAGSATRSPRDTEYAVFAQVTRRLKAVDEADKRLFPALAQAVMDNQKLWGVLAEDLLEDGNQLPLALRAQLLSLAEFVRRQSLAVLGGRASVAALIDINTAIMRGLRGEPEAAA